MKKATLIILLFLLSLSVNFTPEVNKLLSIEFHGSTITFQLDKYIIYKMILLTSYQGSPFLLKPDQLQSDILKIFPRNEIQDFINKNNINLSLLNDFQIIYFLRTPFGEDISPLPKGLYDIFSKKFNKQLAAFWNIVQKDITKTMNNSSDVLTSLGGLLELKGNIVVNLSFSIEDIRNQKDNLTNLYWGETNTLNSVSIEMPFCEPAPMLELLLHELTHVYQYEFNVKKTLSDIAFTDSEFQSLLSQFMKCYTTDSDNYSTPFDYFFEYNKNLVFLNFTEAMGEINGYFYYDKYLIPLYGDSYAKYMMNSEVYFYTNISDFRKKYDIDKYITTALTSGIGIQNIWFQVMKRYLLFLIQNKS